MWPPLVQSRADVSVVRGAGAAEGGSKRTMFSYNSEI